MGQFTGLLNELDNAAPKTKDTNATKRSPEKQAVATKETPAKTSPNAKGKPNNKQANGNAVTTTAAPMRGKRSHPDYTQAPAFIRKDTYKAVKIALLHDDSGLDYSDLVQHLLTAWLANRK